MTMLSKINDQLQYDLLSGCLDATDVGMCVIGTQDKLIMVNKHICRLLNVDAIDLLDKPVLRLFAHLSKDLDRDAWLVDQNANQDMQVKVHIKQKLCYLSLKKRFVQHTSGEVFKTLVIHDVTTLNEAAQMLEASKRQWQALNAGVVISDAMHPDLPIVFVNPAFEAMTGYCAADILGKNCSFLQAHDRNQEGLHDIRRAIKQQTNGYAVLRNYKKDGTQFINELFISPVFDAHQTLIHFVGIQHLRSSDFIK